MKRKVLAWLLRHANMYWRPSRDFYDLKTRLLHAYATRDGFDVQHIVDHCWNCEGAGCSRCQHTGIWSERWVKLDRWRWGAHTFHEPVGSDGPGFPVAWWRSLNAKPRERIEGRIWHEPRRPNAPSEAMLWLYVLAGEWRLFWRTLSSQRRGLCGAWPMLCLQVVVFEARMKIGRLKTCSCGRRFLSRGGWQICGRCRRASERTSELLALTPDDDIPF